MKLYIPLTPRRITQTLLAPTGIFYFLKEQVAHAYDCFWDRFPLTIGSDTGDTKITHLDFETNDVLYMAGVSKGQEFIASGASQSVFIAKQDGK